MPSGFSKRRVALMGIFAAVYAVLRLIPVSELVGISSTLTMGEVFSPLAGMILGPFAGGASVLLGTFAVAGLGRPLVFDGLDFIPGAVGAITAGYAIQGRVKEAGGLSLVLVAVYMLDPLSAPFVSVGSVPVPFAWMHILSVAVYVAVAYGRKHGLGFASRDVMVAASVFIATMSAHIAGSIMFENVLVRVNGAMAPSVILKIWPVVFYLYPIERTFFTAAGALLAVPVLRAIPAPTLELLRGGRR